MGIATITPWNLAGGGSPAGGPIPVDFDPQTLEVSYTTSGGVSANDSTQSGARSKAPAQQTGQSSTLAMTLLFDSTVDGSSVQLRTDPIVALTKAKDPSGSSASARNVVRFQWGSFVFVGTIAALTQTLDFFSDAGVPLRASVHVTVMQVDPPEDNGSASATNGPQPGFGANASAGASFGASAGASIGAGASVGAGASFSAGASISAGAGASIGTTPLTLSQSGDTIQAIAARSGAPSWKAVATANDIDNPRLLPPGTVLDARASVTAG